MSIYVKFVEGGTIYGTNIRILQMGSDSYPRFLVYADSDRYHIEHTGLTQVGATAAIAPVLGDVVELLATMTTDGSVTLIQSVNSAAATSSAASADAALASAWSAQTLHLNQGASSFRGYIPLGAAVVARGSHSLADFRALLS